MRDEDVNELRGCGARGDRSKRGVIFALRRGGFGGGVGEELVDSLSAEEGGREALRAMSV